MTEPMIRFERVEKRYGPVKALDGLSFSVPATGCLGLLGPNGSGKTTAFKCLLGLTRLDGGSIVNRARRSHRPARNLAADRPAEAGTLRDHVHPHPR